VTHLGRTAWPEVPSGALVLVPVGSTEQHGPQLPFDTDTLIAVAVAERAALALADRPVVVAPALAFGASGEHQDFPGTVSIGADALRFVLIELARSVRTWAPRLVFVNGHGGNVPAMSEAVAQLVDEGHDAAWVPCGTPTGDAHAGRSETSLLLRLHPERVGSERPSGADEPIGALMPRLIAEGVRSVSPNGVLGDARGASAEEGARLLDGMVASAVRRIVAASTDDRGCLRDPVASRA
jgi:creatinine amidohydrolase